MTGDEAGQGLRGAGARVADHLRTAILSGEYRAGDPIRQETLAKQLGASRLPVREALRTLEGEGLVTLEPHKGARVTALDAAEFDLLYSTRIQIEPLVLIDSVPRLPDAVIETNESILDRIEAGVSLVDFLVLDRKFHLATLSACQSPQLRSIVERLWNSTQQYRRALVLADRDAWLEETNIEHRLLHAAIADRNAEVAALVLETHITRTRTILRRSPEIFGLEDRKAAEEPVYVTA